jgi:aryl-alcohol dehydrogenase-like predicted oxidoreductase
MTYGEPATGELKPGRQAWALNEKESQPFFRQALDLGINFFDTANVYSSGSSEEVLGRFLKDNTRREAAVIATKVHSVMRDEPNGRGLSRKAILFEIDQSLRRLQTDYVDLYQIHRWDYETPIEETLEALHDVVKSGKARYIGALPCTHGNSPKPSISPTFMAGPVSSPCRIIGTCSIGKRSGR